MTNPIGIEYPCPKCGRYEIVNVADVYFDNPPKYRAVHELFKPPEDVEVPPELSDHKPGMEHSREGCAFIAIGVGFIILERVIHFFMVDMTGAITGSAPDYPEFLYKTFCGWGPAIICFIIAIILFVRTGISNSSERNDHMSYRINYDRTRNEAIRRNTKYKDAMRKYRKLYYCPYCDIVFNEYSPSEYKIIAEIDQLLE